MIAGNRAEKLLSILTVANTKAKIKYKKEKQFMV